MRIAGNIPAKNRSTRYSHRRQTAGSITNSHLFIGSREASRAALTPHQIHQSSSSGRTASMPYFSWVGAGSSSSTSAYFGSGHLDLGTTQC